MNTNILCFAEPQFSLEISDDQVIKLCLAGKIERCEGSHENQEEGDCIYHPAEGYKIDAGDVEHLLRRVW